MVTKKFKCSQCAISCVIASASSRHLPKRCPFVEEVYHDKCKWEEIKPLDIKAEINAMAMTVHVEKIAERLLNGNS